MNSVSSVMDAFSHLVKGSIEMITSHTKITDLDEHSFHHILEYLTLHEVFLCRRVNKYFMRQIESYLENYRHFTYDCRMNGIKMLNGEYVFNGLTLDFMLSKMPNVRVMRFERCPEMRGALATTTFNIIRSLANNLVMLNELHITRTRALDRPSIQLLVDWFPNLTHLTMTVYNETLVEIVVRGLANLKYFNLDDSVLNNYGPHLEHLGLKIHTFIAAPDHSNYKTSIIDGLLKGNNQAFGMNQIPRGYFCPERGYFDGKFNFSLNLAKLRLNPVKFVTAVRVFCFWNRSLIGEEVVVNSKSF